jgi:methyl-accepting chemotaxis protein
MLSRFSISVLLKSVIALMGAVIVVMLALSARESCERLQTANRIAGVANVSAYMFVALNGLRVDRFSTARDLVGERQFTSMDPLIQGARDKEMPALRGLLAALATVNYPDRDQAIADFSGRIQRFADLQEKTAAAVLQPKSARPPELAEEYGKEGDGLMAALDMWGTRLVKYISLQDPYVDQLLEIKQLAWTMRNAAGNMSLVVSNGIAGIAPPPNALLTYTGNAATLDSAWAALNDIASRLPPAPGLTAAIGKFKTDFIGSTYPEQRLKVLKQLIAGEPTGLTVEQWSPNSVGKLALTLGIATAALDAAKEQAATQSATAWHDLMVQVALLIAACVLAGGMMLVVSRHVTGPLGAIQAAMLKLAGGDFEVVLPGLHRKDEIGAVANAVERFKVLAVDKARNEADAAMARQKAEADSHAEAARVEAEAQAKVTAERAKAAEEQAHAFRTLGTALGHLADGDFTIRLADNIPEAYSQIRDDFNRAIGRLHETIQAVASSTREVANAASEISTATTDLSQRVGREPCRDLGLDGGNLRDGADQRQECAERQCADQFNAGRRRSRRQGRCRSGHGDVADRGILTADLRHHHGDRRDCAADQSAGAQRRRRGGAGR